MTFVAHAGSPSRRISVQTVILRCVTICQIFSVKVPTRNLRVGAIPIPLLEAGTLAGTGELADVSVPKLIKSVLDLDCVSVSGIVLARNECVHAKILSIRITGCRTDIQTDRQTTASRRWISAWRRAARVQLLREPPFPPRHKTSATSTPGLFCQAISKSFLGPWPWPS